MRNVHLKRISFCGWQWKHLKVVAAGSAPSSCKPGTTWLARLSEETHPGNDTRAPPPKAEGAPLSAGHGPVSPREGCGAAAFRAALAPTSHFPPRAGAEGKLRAS